MTITNGHIQYFLTDIIADNKDISKIENIISLKHGTQGQIDMELGN